MNRLREMCPLRAFPLRWSWPSLLVWLEHPRLRVTGNPHAEIEREGERCASDGIRQACAERLEVDDVHRTVRVAPPCSAGEGVEAGLAQGGPHETTYFACDVSRVHRAKFAVGSRLRLHEPVAHTPLVLAKQIAAAVWDKPVGRLEVA